MKSIVISRNEAGQRLDKYLKKYFPLANSGFLYKMLRKKNIVLNGKKSDGSDMIKMGDSLTFFLSQETIDKFRGVSHQEPQQISWPSMPLSILYEDDDYLFINKPAGILSQKAQKEDVSMVEYVIGYLLSTKSLGVEELETFHPSVANRLDRNTSGLILAGKSLAGLQNLSRWLKLRSMKKYYLCLVKGKLTGIQYQKAYMIKDSHNNQVSISAKPQAGSSVIETGYEALWTNEKETLLKVELITGKTHQIRSHLAWLGHPLAGDHKYGDMKWNQLLAKNCGLKRQFLHAWELVFPDEEGMSPSLRSRTFQAELPEDLMKVLRQEEIPWENKIKKK